MLALLGLIGIAFAGTAFVGTLSPIDDEGSDTTGTFRDEPESAEDELSVPDFLEDIQLVETTQTDVADVAADIIVSAATDDGDVIAGGDADDVIDGQLGDDYLDGGDGNDTVIGGGGFDQMHGGDGNDVMSGDDGDDLVYGYIGDDSLTGGDGHDKLHGGDGTDMINGGDGDDVMSGGYGDDTLIGGAGRDNLQGSEGDDVIDGVTGEDIAERDYLNGSEGNDILIGNNGDVMSGGDDADQFVITGGTVSIMDYADDDLLVLNFEGDAPVLTTELNDTGLTLLANGLPVASLFGLTAFDVSTVQLVAS